MVDCITKITKKKLSTDYVYCFLFLKFEVMKTSKTK